MTNNNAEEGLWRARHFYLPQQGKKDPSFVLIYPMLYFERIVTSRHTCTIYFVNEVRNLVILADVSFRISNRILLYFGRDQAWKGWFCQFSLWRQPQRRGFKALFLFSFDQSTPFWFWQWLSPFFVEKSVIYGI